MRREFFQRIEAPYELTGVNAGEVEAVHEQTLENLHRQQLVEVQGQSDVAGHRAALPRPVQRELDHEPDPRRTAWGSATFNMYRDKPLVRQGGVVILYHPVPWEFHQLHHPSYVDFFEEVLRRDHRPGDDRGEVRGAVRDRPLVHPPVPDVARVPRRAPVLHVVLGRARAATTSAT